MTSNRIRHYGRIRYTRYSILALALVLSVISLGLLSISPWAWLGVLVFGALGLLGLTDIFQTKHAILRNYPVLGHLRFLFEGIRPEIRQFV